VWDAEQRAVAATIVTVGQSRGMPPRALVIALATAMQESQLRNLPGGDADSIGVFQQRPSAGWGTPAQLASPAYQAGAFYTALAVVPGWQTMPLTQAAQAVQRSAHPDAYAKWAAPALTLYQHVGSTNSRAIPEDLEQFVSTPGCAFGGGDGLPNGAEVKLPAGFALPPGTPAQVATAVTWALGQLGTPYSYGGDCTAAHSGDPRHECDCSSLVQKAFEAAGIDLPRTTGGQVTVGTPVPDLATIRAGDLVFIPGSDPRETPASPGHVGLAISYDLIIQAPHSHARVQITRIADWARSVTAARRIVK
jgi:cell wall-associated NlpC family hydrolase